jgi:hypothetical protein
MKASLWAVIFSAAFGLTAKGQELAFSPATNELAPTRLGKNAQIHAEDGKST